MLRTIGLLALPGRTLSAGFDGGISPSGRFVAAQLLGGWDLTETGLPPAAHARLPWTKNASPPRQPLQRCSPECTQRHMSTPLVGGNHETDERRDIMILGMTTATYTFLHVLISLGGIGSGFMVLWGLLTSKRLDSWTALFLA